MLYPLKFNEIYKQYIWGGRNLEHLEKRLPEGIVAESWEISSRSDGDSIVSNGIFCGKTLSELTKTLGEKLLGSELVIRNINKFPLLVKFIDAERKLSLQVHPNDDYALKNEGGELGKSEFWYVISAKPGARIVQGVVQGINKEIFKKDIENCCIEKCLNYIDVHPGDVINVPAGLVHSIGEGIVVIEIQQNSNITYRVFDYNRLNADGEKRPLHISKALDVINFDNCNVSGKEDGLRINLEGNSYKKFLVANKHFSVEKYIVKGSVLEKTEGKKFFAYTCISGKGKIFYANGEEKLVKGESALIPAYMGQYVICGDLQLLKYYVPDFQEDIFQPLLKAGYSIETIKPKVLTE